MNYTADMVLRVARRYNNEKRKYLLVNPLQGKHLPISPRTALAMMTALGEKVAHAYPSARLVIGFAETATAIGGIVAEALGSACTYIQTTREKPPGIRNWIAFLEEHSHAPEQRLAVDDMEAALARTDTVVFVDDELSTGKTLCNILVQMREALPALREKKLVAASLLNRLTAADAERLRVHGAECIALVKLPESDYEMQVERIAARAAVDCTLPAHRHDHRRIVLPAHRTPRSGVHIGDYLNYWAEAGRRFAESLTWGRQEAILVLGTEECMLPGLWIGKALEEQGYENVVFHATTRSPIGIGDAKDYPVRAGWRIRSFYEAARATYTYNLQPYQHVLIVSDAGEEGAAAVQSLLCALMACGCIDAVYLTSKGE